LIGNPEADTLDAKRMLAERGIFDKQTRRKPLGGGRGYGERTRMARSKADWVLAESEDARLETTDFGGGNNSTGAFDMYIRPLRPARKQTSAWAWREHTA
jgi:hypothetical protein